MNAYVNTRTGHIELSVAYIGDIGVDDIVVGTMDLRAITDTAVAIGEPRVCEWSDEEARREYVEQELSAYAAELGYTLYETIWD